MLAPATRPRSDHPWLRGPVTLVVLLVAVSGCASKHDGLTPKNVQSSRTSASPAITPASKANGSPGGGALSFGSRQPGEGGVTERPETGPGSEVGSSKGLFTPSDSRWAVRFEKVDGSASFQDASGVTVSQSAPPRFVSELSETRHGDGTTDYEYRLGSKRPGETAQEHNTHGAWAVSLVLADNDPNSPVAGFGLMYSNPRTAFTSTTVLQFDRGVPWMTMAIGSDVTVQQTSQDPVDWSVVVRRLAQRHWRFEATLDQSPGYETFDTGTYLDISIGDEFPWRTIDYEANYVSRNPRVVSRSQFSIRKS